MSYILQVEEYLALRRGLGCRLAGQGLLLLDFGRFLDRLGHGGPLTIDLALRWARPPCSKDPDQAARRLGAIRGFLRHRAGFDPANEVPSPQLLGSGIRRKPPHIFTEAEVEALLCATSELRPRKGLRPLSYNVLFSLLLSTGLRVSEALHLEDRDVDLGEGVLTVRDSKFGRSRLVPLHPTALQPLRHYIKLRNRKVRGSTAFFRTEGHSRLEYTPVRMTFIRLRRLLGWTSEGRARRPRIMDMRHTFAVRCLLRWCRAGHQVDQKIEHLATYLGHVEVRDTYWYLTAVPELAALAAERFEAFAQRREEKS